VNSNQYWSKIYKIKNGYTEEFKMESGVPPGDPLSATSLGLVVGVTLKQLGLRGNISTRLTQCSVYADGIFVNYKNKTIKNSTYQRLKNQSIHFGLIVKGGELNTVFFDR
jgi:hypothetical protein